MQKRILTTAVAAAIAFPAFVPATFAANHALNIIRYDAPTNLNTVDFTMSVDWDYDNPPTTQGTVLNRAYIQACIDEFARSTFQMTEGRVRVGKVSVFKNSLYLRNVSITLLNKDGRANAHISGFGVPSMRAEQFVTSENRIETPFQIGRTITHEMGHYLLGIYDEYVETGKALNPDNPGSPSGVDTPKDTMMQNHEQFLKLSTPGDYADESKRQTAHFRVFGESAWDSITRDSATDRDVAKNLRGGRARSDLQALRFTNKPADAAALQTPTAGYDAALRIDYLATAASRATFLIDRSLAAEDFEAAKQAAIQAMRKLPLGSTVTVQGYVAQLDADPIIDRRGIPDEAARDAIAASIAMLQPQSGTSETDTAVLFALTPFANADASDQRAIYVLTLASNTVSDSTADRAKTLSIAVSALAIRPSATNAGAFFSKRAGAKSVPAPGRTSLADLAVATGGFYVATNKGSELEAKAGAAASATAGGNEQTAGSLETALLKAGERAELAVGIHTAIDTVAYLEASEGERDGGKLTYSLIAPNGAVISSMSPPAGITFEYNAEGKRAEFAIATTFPGFNGTWRLRATANSALVEPAFLEASVGSTLNMGGNVTGEKAADRRPVVLTARLEGGRAVIGATMTADLYDADGALVRADIPMRDDGKLPDAAADDGQYAAVMPVAGVGEYYAVIKAVGVNGVTKLSTAGSLKKGVNAPEVSLPAFNRELETGFVVDGVSAGDLDRDGIPDPIEAVESRNPFTKDNDVLSVARLAAQQSYRDFFGGEGDASGVTYWQGQISAGTPSRAAMAEAFLRSPPFARGAEPTARLYRAFYQRSPDHAGLVFWSGRIAGGAAVSAVAESFAQSPEFQSAYGSLTDSAFVDRVYQNVLGRTADAGGRSYWLGELTARRITRGALMAQFSESAENVVLTRSLTTATLLYVTLLRRAPDAAGLAFWAGQLDRGTTPRSMADAIINTAEYRARFL